ncbi:MobA/MobL family protein, partial [Acinetobacter ursingii]|uniref:MobA/MobL family protein n=1 Tax=Acinetobacter ursingii TaxID=108980 RepID=UPI003AF4D2F9
LLNRQKLWNSVEKVDRRKDATLSREFEIAFPNELNAEQRKSMLDDLCKKLVEKYVAVVDAAIHAPHKNSGSDERNYHALIMFTTRSIDLET